MNGIEKEVNKPRVVFFGDGSSFITTILFNEVLKFHCNLIEIILVVDTNPKTKRELTIRKIIKSLIIKIFNPSLKVNFGFYDSFVKFVPKGIPIMKPDSINDDNFIRYIRELKPDYGFSFGNPQIMKPKLINSFKRIINYHNSILPKYRGLHATAWSMFFSEDYTGYTFHEVNEKIDDGNIIIQESFKIDYSKTPYEIEVIKTKKAAKKIKQLIEYLQEGYEGMRQEGESSYFGRKELDKLLTFKEINKDNIDKIMRIIKIFGAIYLQREEEKVLITSIDKNGNIKRIKFLPPILYRIIKYFKSDL